MHIGGHPEVACCTELAAAVGEARLRRVLSTHLAACSCAVLVPWKALAVGEVVHEHLRRNDAGLLPAESRACLAMRLVAGCTVMRAVVVQ